MCCPNGEGDKGKLAGVLLVAVSAFVVGFGIGDMRREGGSWSKWWLVSALEAIGPEICINKPTTTARK